MRNSVIFPECDLLPEEKEANTLYPESAPKGEKPKAFVLTRLYPLSPLIKTAVPGETDVFTVNYTPSGRRTRIYALTMSGDLELWNLNLFTSADYQVLKDVRASALMGTTATFGGSAPSARSLPETLLSGAAAYPKVFDPPIILEGQIAMRFEGQYVGPSLTAPTDRSVLNMCFWVWEFPGGVKFPPRGQ